ncbi:hypothetical protein C8K36_102498 [Rhodococcus sp. OK519]|uniref:hypothetical protein n=1 Tax=Rhodococcus sp. OK519 TaxID=2135729 RepID=UPI000D3C96E1|nr:hypothetical protein C8K36_102498 [Rhodococcus sp. OK519]
MTDRVDAGRQWYDRAGRPIPPEEAEKLLAQPGYDRIGSTTVLDMADLDWIRDISTVWIGLDFNPDGKPGPPLIFEAAVFDRDHATLEHRWYATEEEAELAHEAFVAAACDEAFDPVVLEASDPMP